MRMTLACLLLTLGVSPLTARENIVETAATNGEFKTLVNLLVVTGLDDALASDGHFTVFAPSDEAFAKLPEETVRTLLKKENRDQLASILKYHVINRTLLVPKNPPSHPINEAESLQGELLTFDRNGSEVRVNNAEIVARNIRCSNGVIHVIDSVLLPPEPQSSNTIADVATAAGQFETLLAAAKAAGLVDALTGDDDLTVFAPTDEAFAKLPEGTIKSLLQPENRNTLAMILKYHVVGGRVLASDFVTAGTASTLAGPSINASIDGGQLRVNDATIIANDIAADNGVIHIIDSVLLPPDADARSDRSASQPVSMRRTHESCQSSCGSH